ncbi:OB-fold protein [Flavobacterium cellulosilyticum]|uniref:tRNA_anti-like n=1 Tax=Flavobacterium cellulosilyticum TaxID=2541731 RepID=A0A4R5CDI2_9FLAO|nr:hypothetical protein [Flavobacterium cellulosilyticum]TDD96979.1 hypothetical protein E0F76_10085 [Flavobacterium cellulosilyticum]
MKKINKIILIALLVIGLLGISSYYYVMYGGARNLSNEDTAFTVTAKSISNEFAANVEISNKKYLEKAIAIKGTITKVAGNEVIIDDYVICNLKELDPSILKNQVITLKGRVVGYDDLIGELKLDQCFKAF